MNDTLELFRIEPISREDATAVAGGMMKLPSVEPVTTVKTDYGWTWGTVSDLPASEGVGIVIRF